jgi:hypothetical protein
MGITWALAAPFLRKYGNFDADARRAKIDSDQELRSTPNGIRTRAATLKG